MWFSLVNSVSGFLSFYMNFATAKLNFTMYVKGSKVVNYSAGYNLIVR